MAGALGCGVGADAEVGGLLLTGACSLGLSLFLSNIAIVISTIFGVGRLSYQIMLAEGQPQWHESADSQGNHPALNVRACSGRLQCRAQLLWLPQPFDLFKQLCGLGKIMTQVDQPLFDRVTGVCRIVALKVALKKM